MKLAMSFYITQQQAKEIMKWFDGIESNHEVDISHNERDDFGLISVWDGVNAPPMHQELVAVFKNISSYYGEISGFTAMTSGGNKFALAIADEDDGEDFVGLLQFDGTRGRFIEECNAWFKESTLQEVVWRNSPDEPILTDSAVVDDEELMRNETIISYQSEGPKDMYPWENRSRYIIRQGGNVLSDEVKQILNNELYGVIVKNASDWLAFGVKGTEVFYSEYYAGCTDLTDSSDNILRHWFEAIETRETRVAMAKNYFKTREVADSILNLMV